MTLKKLSSKVALTPLWLIGAACQVFLIAVAALVFGTGLALLSIFEPLTRLIFKKGETDSLWKTTEAMFKWSENIIQDLAIIILQAIHIDKYSPHYKDSVEIGIFLSLLGGSAFAMTNAGLTVASLSVPLTIPFAIMTFIAAPVFSTALLEIVKNLWPTKDNTPSTKASSTISHEQGLESDQTIEKITTLTPSFNAPKGTSGTTQNQSKDNDSDVVFSATF